MTILRPLVAGLFLLILVTTSLAVWAEGWGFVPAFLADLTAPGWRAQFNVDFATYLILSAVWVIWRHGGTWQGWVLGLIVGVLGMLVFAPYVLWAAHQAKGDLRHLLLGVHS